MRNFFLLVFASLIFISFSACNLINPAEVVPTYVQIDSFSFSGNTLKTGSLSHKITNVWVYFNDAPVGNFELPAKFPVIATDSGKLTVIAGIDYDGLKGVEAQYPLYRSDYMYLKPQPGSVIPFHPATRYNDSVKLQYQENFDGGSGTVNTFSNGKSQDTILNQTTTVFEGTGSGMIQLYPGKDSAIVYGGKVNPITAGLDAYVELDYKGDLNLLVGMWDSSLSTGETSYQEIIGLKPQTQWTKIYVDFKNFISSHQNSDIRVRLRAVKPGGVSTGNVFIDNVKVVSF